MRRTLSSKSLAKVILFSFIVLSAVALIPARVDATGIPSNVTPLVQGYNGQMIVESDTVLTLNSHDEIMDLYQALGIESFPPDLDMNETTVVAVVASPRPSSGYAVQVVGVYPNEDHSLTIEVLESMPNELCDALTVETAPFQVVAVARKLNEDNSRVRWNKVEVNCQ